MKSSRLLTTGLVTVGLLASFVIAVIGTGAAADRSKPDLALIAEVVELVQRNYVHPVGSDRLTQNALKGMLARLDPHSAYMNEQEFRESQQDIKGKFGGIGVEVSDRSGVPMVVSPVDGTPAALAGLQPGDLIISVDGKNTNGMDLTQVVNNVRGKPGSAVTLTIARDAKAPFDVMLKRSLIQVHTVTSKLEQSGIGYVRISEFGQDTAADLKRAIATLKKDAGGQLKGLVLDLRDDPGGLLAAAVEVSGDFLDGGTVVAVKGRRHSDDQVFKARARGDLVSGTPIAVLINGASASASEILAGALQDRHRATVMGTQSFGKGSVQSVIPLAGHGALRVTTALYYTPSGRSIQDEGISPDIVAEAPKGEQVARSLVLRESQLHGAFANPGPLKTNDHAAQRPPIKTTAYSPPIKEFLIGTPRDAQLTQALDFLKRTSGSS